MIKQREANSWKSVSYAKSISGAQTYTKFPIVLRTTEQSIPTWNVKGNMQQSGTPTPTSPITPQECGMRTENLFDGIVRNAIINDSTGEEQSNANWRCSNFIEISAEKVTLSWTSDSQFFQAKIGYYEADETFISTETVQGYYYSGTFTIPNNCKYIKLSYSVAVSGGQVTRENIMLNTGSTAKPYEPYGYKIPIVSGNTTTNIYLSEPLRKIGDYADTIAADGTVTRVIKKLVLDGTDGFVQVTSGFGFRFSLEIPDGLPSDSLIGVRSWCSHFGLVGTGQTYNIQNAYTISGTPALLISKDSSTTLTTFNQFLAAQYSAGTPVTVWYTLSTPTTESTTTSAIPTTSGINTIDVATTLKPSEMSLTYDGYKLCKGQRYSRTENLWNEDYTDISSIAVTYKPVYVGNGQFTLSTSARKTESENPSYTGNANIFLLSGNVSSGASTNGNGVWSTQPRTVTSDNGYITIAYRYLVGDNGSNPQYNTTMLNTGSTAKPYQPYLDWE